ncbi:MAG: type II toxin-antitoxin system HicB family antitoxin [Pyrinomonadaceae bacterium]
MLDNDFNNNLEIMNLAIELEQETDGRWIAEIDALNGVLVYGETREEAIRKVKTLAFRVIADRLENGEIV